MKVNRVGSGNENFYVGMGRNRKKLVSAHLY